MTIAAETIQVVQRESNHTGGRYEGEVSIATGQREGQGKYIYPNSYFTYEGQWAAGRKHGIGQLNFGDGGFYKGAFDRGEITGQGCQTWADGTVYTGEFVSGTKHGEGVLEKPDGTSYVGFWEHNRYSGEGQLTVPSSGETYCGYFHAHKYHGGGELSQTDRGRRYVGSFECGVFEGEGELSENDGAFVYQGQFRAGLRDGEGTGTDVASGISFKGDWEEDQPARRGVAWDLADPQTEESFLVVAESLREEAAQQLNPVTPDPKQAKGKKAESKKAAAPVPVDPNLAQEQPQGPQLELTAGEDLPMATLRIVDERKAPLTSEAGRNFRVTMYRERSGKPSEENLDQPEVLRREVRFGDRRMTFVDPLDFEDPSTPVPSSKGSPTPPPVEGEQEEDEPPYEGEEAVEGTVAEDGQITIGGSEEWFLPVHLQAGIYWLRVDETTNISPASFWKTIGYIEFPVRVNAAAPQA